MKAYLGYLTAVLVTIATAGAYVAYSADASTAHAMIKARAQKIFTYDREHQNILPAHALRALSLAIEFHNDSGADEIMSQLEQQL